MSRIFGRGVEGAEKMSFYVDHDAVLGSAARLSISRNLFARLF
jgi:hypothetical protein